MGRKSCLCLPTTYPSPVSLSVRYRRSANRRCSLYADASDYLSDQPPTVTSFDVMEIMVPPSVVVKALGRSILLDPEAKSLVLVHSPAHRARGQKERYPLYLA
ncbi:hypothetical protein C8J57DRAFT_1721454, partial [Mycena rebaudengoi]